MKRYGQMALILGSLIFLALGWAQTGDHGAYSERADKADRAVQAGMPIMKVEFENESLVVLRLRLKPHEKTPMHEMTPRVVVWLTDVHLRDTSPNGTVVETRRKAGAVDWYPVQEHAGENLSDQPLEFIAIVPKSTAQPGSRHGRRH